MQRLLLMLPWLGVIAVLGLIHGCAQRAAPGAIEVSRPIVSFGSAASANDVLFRAISLVGTPYRYGGNTPEGGFDCSGLVGYVFREAAGVVLPRSSTDIARVDAGKVGRSALAGGDLVFFGPRGRVNHVGIYVGEGRFVHAPTSGGTVRLDPLDGHYWRDNFLFGRRLLR
jgi:cell wall-associated NlpC family hydrolase